MPRRPSDLGSKNVFLNKYKNVTDVILYKSNLMSRRMYTIYNKILVLFAKEDNLATLGLFAKVTYREKKTSYFLEKKDFIYRYF